MAFQDHHHLSPQEMPLDYSDHHHHPASVFRSILPDHHHSPEEKPLPVANSWLHHPHQWLTNQSQRSPLDKSDHHHRLEIGEGDNSNSNGNRNGSSASWEREKCKADILGHPLYEQLLSAHVACLRIATPVDQLPRIDAQLAQSQQVVAKYSVLGQGQRPLDDKELDHFMVEVDFFITLCDSVASIGCF